MLCNASTSLPSLLLHYGWIPPLLGTPVLGWNKGEVVVVVVVVVVGGVGRVVWKDSGKRIDDLLFCSLQTCGSFLKTSDTICKIMAENSHATTAIAKMTFSYIKIKPDRIKGVRFCLPWLRSAYLVCYDVCAENRVRYWIHGTFLHYLCRRARLIGAALHEPWNGGVHALLSTGCALGQKSFKYSVH